MKILMNCHAYVPMANAGAEKSFHDVARLLVARGHEVRVIVPFVRDYELDGVKVIKESTENGEHWRWCDIVFTQLNATGMSINTAKHYQKPLVHFARNDNNYDMVRYKHNAAIVYNSQWVKESLNYPIPSFVMPPSVDYRHYDVGGDPYGRKYITLINHNENKGANQVLEIAKRLPNRQFLFVDGGYGDQITAGLPNITVWPHQNDIREAYKVTRLLLMPSKYESWGRTCVEAMANGIPVIHANTPGLVECANGSQVVDDRSDTAAWVRDIARLDDWHVYQWFSAEGRIRAKQLDPQALIPKFETWLNEIAAKPWRS